MDWFFFFFFVSGFCSILYEIVWLRRPKPWILPVRVAVGTLTCGDVTSSTAFRFLGCGGVVPIACPGGERVFPSRSRIPLV